MLKKTRLSMREQQQVLELFKKKPHLEKMLDWNNYKELNWIEHFVPLFSMVSKSERKRKVKSDGIKGLKIGTDYIPAKVDQLSSEPFGDAGEFIGAYFPLNYESSKLIASKSIGGTTGKWCTAYQKSDSHWYDYTLDGDVFIYVVYENTKYAIQIRSIFDWTVWDQKDDPTQQGDVPMLDVSDLLNSNKKLINDIRIELQDQELPQASDRFSLGETIEYYSTLLETEVTGEIVDMDDNTVFVSVDITETIDPESQTITKDGEEIYSDDEIASIKVGDEIVVGDDFTYIIKKINEDVTWTAKMILTDNPEVSDIM